MTESMRTPGDSIALTPMQSWMFYESVPADRPWVNLQQAILRLDGQVVSREDLDAAWNAVADLHPALRASIRWRNLEKPLQIVADAVDVDVEELDWQDKPAETQEEALEDFLARDRHRGLDVEIGPALAREPHPSRADPVGHDLDGPQCAHRRHQRGDRAGRSVRGTRYRCADLGPADE